MSYQQPSACTILCVRLRTIPRFFCAAIFTVAVFAPAQTFTVLHQFTGGADGNQPWAGLTVGPAGNLYGTASEGGYNGGDCLNYYGCGTAFSLKPGGSGWTFSTLYTFHDTDGATPYGGLVFGPDGALYGTTFAGGVYGGYCCGAVFELRPPATICKSTLCPWTQNLLWSFTLAPDGNNPYMGNLIFDPAGHVLGTTTYGGTDNYGTVFELAKQSGSWTENILYSFGLNGKWPFNGLIFDNDGNVYATTNIGGAYGFGAVVELVNSPDGWTETDLYSFTGGTDGGYPYAGLIFDQAGNLYGTTSAYGSSNHNPGTIFELTPSNGGWTFNLIYGDGGTWSSLTMDAAGDLYGQGNNAVFKLTRSSGSWTYTPLHNFTGGSDGLAPIGSVVFDAHGNLYGTTADGGTHGCSNGVGCGVVWEITP